MPFVPGQDGGGFDLGFELRAQRVLRVDLEAALEARELGPQVGHVEMPDRDHDLGVEGVDGPATRGQRRLSHGS